MSYRKSVSRHLGSLNMSGFGEYMLFSSDPELGRGVYEICLNGCILSFFDKGVVVKFEKENIVVLYSDIVKITSHLTAALFSEASANQNVNISIPLEVTLSESVVILDVRLLIYSRVLIVLSDMWRGFKE